MLISPFFASYCKLSYSHEQDFNAVVFHLKLVTTYNAEPTAKQTELSPSIVNNTANSLGDHGNKLRVSGSVPGIGALGARSTSMSNLLVLLGQA